MMICYFHKIIFWRSWRVLACRIFVHICRKSTHRRGK